MWVTGFGGEGQGDGDLRTRKSKRGDDSGRLLAACGGMGVDNISTRKAVAKQVTEGLGFRLQ